MWYYDNAHNLKKYLKKCYIIFCKKWLIIFTFPAFLEFLEQLFKQYYKYKYITTYYITK